MLAKNMTDNINYKKLVKKMIKELKKEMLTSINDDESEDEVLFEDKIEEWLNYKYLTTKESTYAYYHFVVDKHIRNEFHNLKVSEINKKIVDKYVKDKITNSNLSENTIRQLLKVLKLILKYAKIDVEVISPKNSKKEVTILTPREKKVLSEYLINNMNTESLCILLSLNLGLRIGEVCALKWENINLNNKEIKIDNTIVRLNNYDKEVKTSTILTMVDAKTNTSIRVLPLSNYLIEIIKPLIKNKDKDSFILTSTNKFMDPRTFYNHYKNILKKCGITNNYHCLRHTFATNCIDNGLNIKALSQILGHANVQTTLSTYVHSNIEYTRDFLNNNFSL